LCRLAGHASAHAFDPRANFLAMRAEIRHTRNRRCDYQENDNHGDQPFVAAFFLG
jgi:hypothetical protein